MSVLYEWTCEIVATVETEDHDVGSVVDACNFNNPGELRSWIQNEQPEDGFEFHPVLVRLKDGVRSWAYVKEDGNLPNMFYDSNAQDVAKVPLYLIRQWNNS
jgi:hypothetical protein